MGKEDDHPFTMKARRPRRSRMCRRIETIFLGVIFCALSFLLYLVLTTDKIIVLSWLGIQVHNHPTPNINRVQITSSKTAHRLPQQDKNKLPTFNTSLDDGLFLDDFQTHSNSGNSQDEKYFIAIGCAITSKGLSIPKLDRVETAITFLRTFFPSFCKTRPPTQHIYSFYIAYDRDDSFYMSQESQQVFISRMKEIQKQFCPEKLEVKVKFHGCEHNGQPAWAQNDAMMAAYLDNMDYFYRINDDTSLLSSNWTEIMVNSLRSNNPPNVGVVGPDHKGGNDAILVYDFVHKTHVDIFGFYYPRTFPDWWADDWMSAVYGSGRTHKLESVKAIHTGEKGTRYNHSWIPPSVLGNRVTRDRATLNRYLQFRSPPPGSPTPSLPKGKAVISMSLYGKDPKYTYGAIRNAQLQPIIFPGWKLRFYVEKPTSSGQTLYPKVPTKIIHKLKSLGAEIVFVDTHIVNIPPMLWRFLVADDLDTDTFIIRDADSRLIERDAEVVNEWLESDRPFHCVRDHPSHKSHPIYGGLFGGRSKDLRDIVREQWRALMRVYQDGYAVDLEFLNNQIWTRVKYSSLCHDSVSCRDFPNAWPFPSPRKGYEHVGQVFDAYGEGRSIDTDILMLYKEPWECTLREGESRQSWLLKQKANGKPEGGLREKPKVSFKEDFKEEARRREESKIPYLTGKVVIWSMDFDTKLVRDLKDMLGGRGVTFIDKSLSPDCLQVGTCPHNLSVITPDNAMDGGRELAGKFYERYKDDPEMKQVTHFLCSQPVAMCELYQAFKEKKMIIVATGRYELARITPERWNDLNAFLKDTEQKQRNIVGANNHYDVEYMRYFTGFDPEFLPNLAAYTGTTYSHSKSAFLVTHIEDPDFRSWFLQALQGALEKAKSREKVEYVDDVYPTGYNHSHLATHPGLIIVPQKVSDITFLELYRMNIPLFFPSLELLARWQQKHHILRNRTHNTERLNRYGISLKVSPIHPAAMGRFDPNDSVSGMSLRYWLRFADFLQLPDTGHYETLDQLVDLLTTTDLRVTSIKMKTFNKRFKREIISKWINLLNKTLL